MTKKKLSQLSRGEQGIVESVLAGPELTEQLLELGIGPGESIAMIGKSPFGDPVIIGLLNYRLAIRKSEAERILLREVETTPAGNGTHHA